VCQRTFCTYILFDNEDDAKSHYTNAKLPSMGLFFEPNNMTSYTVRYPTAAQVPAAVLSTDPGESLECSFVNRRFSYSLKLAESNNICTMKMA